MTPETQERFILRAACKDAIGIVADVAGFLAERRLFIAETANFGDAASGMFFMRLLFAPTIDGFTLAKFSAEFAQNTFAQFVRLSAPALGASARPDLLAANLARYRRAAQFGFGHGKSKKPSEEGCRITCTIPDRRVILVV